MPQDARLPHDFDEFVSARWDSLLRYAYVLTGDIHEAQDLVQEALARAWSRWRRLEPAGAEAYVRRIVCRLAWQRSKRRAAPAATDSLETDLHTAEHPHDVAVGRGMDVARALATLSSDQRVVIVLRYWLGMDEATIAEELGCRRGTVKSRASRAYAELRGNPLLAEYRSNEHDRAENR